MSYNEDHININNINNVNMSIMTNNGNRKQHLRPLVPKPPHPISTHHHHCFGMLQRLCFFNSLIKQMMRFNLKVGVN